MILIADSSALIALSICDSLELLDKLFVEVRVPRSVFKEINQKHKKEAEKLKNYLETKIIDYEINISTIIRRNNRRR